MSGAQGRTYSSHAREVGMPARSRAITLSNADMTLAISFRVVPRPRLKRTALWAASWERPMARRRTTALTYFPLAIGCTLRSAKAKNRR